MTSLYQHIYNMKPILDRDGKFIFTSNSKVAQMSVARHLLKKRCIIFKDNPEKYTKHLDNYNIEDAYKFTIVRNPWDRFVSAFFYLKKGPIIPNIPFKQFVLEIFSINMDPHFYLQCPRAYYNENLFVNKVAQIENIDEDWAEISKNINCSSKLPHTHKTPHKPYWLYYDNQTREVIGNTYAQDIKLFNYTFLGVTNG